MPTESVTTDSRRWEVPNHSITMFRSKQTKYCVCIPVINEGTRVIEQLRRMQPHSDAIDIFIADGGSTDGSMEPDALAELGVRGLLIKTGPGRLSAQMRMAFAFALKEEYEGIITIDGNNKDDPGAIPLFLKALDAGYDHVQGSRFICGGTAINTPWQRLLGIRLVHAPMISLAAGFRYTDTTNGFRAYSKRFLLDPRVRPFRDIFSAYELHYYLSVRAPRLGFRAVELPVCRSYPDTGKIPTKITGVRGNLMVLATLVRACLHQFDPPSERRL